MFRGLIEGLRVRSRHHHRHHHHPNPNPLDTVTHGKPNYVQEYSQQQQQQQQHHKGGEESEPTTSISADHMMEGSHVSSTARAAAAAAAPQQEQTEQQHNRSVNDFDTAVELKQALLSCNVQGGCHTMENQHGFLIKMNARVARIVKRTKNDSKCKTIDQEPDRTAHLDWIVEKNYDRARHESPLLR